MSRISVTCEDCSVVIDGVGVRGVETTVEAPSYKGHVVSALQWYGDKGEIEFKDRSILNTTFGSEDFEQLLRPYINLHTDVLKKAEATKPTDEEIIRSYRDGLLYETDYLVLSDAPNTYDKNALVAYRQALRDITEQEGFPWEGDVDKVPWPEKPVALSPLPDDEEIEVPTV